MLLPLSSSKPQFSIHPYAKFALKLALSAAAIYFVFRKIELSEILNTLRSAQPIWLLLAMVAFNLSKVHSATRQLRIFSQIGVQMAPLVNLKLYYVGMFYNLFLPGGIGGDGYKVWYLKGSGDKGTRLLVAAVLLDRVAGAAILAGMALLLTAFADGILLLLPHYAYGLALGGAALSVPIFVLLVHYVFPSFKRGVVAMVLYSLRVQVMQLICAWLILRAFGIYDHYLLYFIVFLVSSLAAMLPISFGGIGLRELVFLYAADYLPLDGNAAVSLALVFFLITALSSFTGAALKLPQRSTLKASAKEG